jgi:hypothetical protein
MIKQKLMKIQRKKISVIFVLIITLFSGCKLVEFNSKNEYREYKYLKKYVNKKFNKVNNILMNNDLLNCKRYRSVYSIEGMEYSYSDSIRITVLFDRKYFIGKDSINYVNCKNINLKNNIRVQSISVYNLKSNGTTTFFSRH